MERNGKYRIECKSPLRAAYFEEKYGSANPDFVLEDKASVVLGPGTPAELLWQMSGGDPTAEGDTYYGKIKQGVVSLGEIVHESELVPVP